MEYFFSCGYNKSGTTFLQMLLDSHPKITCSPEHHLKTIVKGLHHLNEQYRSLIQLFDDRTAQQGIRYKSKRTMTMALRAITQEIYDETYRPNAEAKGISDNWIFEFLPLIDSLRVNQKYIFIVRDPRAISVSLYHHLANTEPHRVRRININEFSQNFGLRWNKHIETIMHFTEAHPERCKIVYYENLVGKERFEEIKKVLNLLQVSASEVDIENMFTIVDSLKNKSKSRNNKFFRKGTANSWQEELSQKSIKKIENRCREQMLRLNYE